MAFIFILSTGDLMNHITKKFILIFGLYLGWILSFTYEGPLFNVIVQIKQYNTDLLLLVMHCAPLLIILFIFRFINKKNDTALLYASISASLILSILFIVLGHNVSSISHYILLMITAILAGMAELFFIICSTGWYIRHVPVKQMFYAMAYIALIANTIVMICNFFIYYHLETVSIIVSLAACLLALILALNIKKDDLNNRPHHKLEFPKYTLLHMCIAFFLFNIGGGVVIEVILPLISQSFGMIEIFSFLPYVLSCALIIFLVKDIKKNIQYLLIIATGIIISGLILFQFIGNQSILLVSNMLIQSGYALMDVFLWGLIGLLSYVYYQPSKIVFFTMSANIIGVITGVLLSKVLSDIQSTTESLSALISLICAMIGMLIVPIIYKNTVVKFNNDVALLNKEEARQNSLNKIRNFKQLSVREQEVAKYLTLELTNEKIAAMLFISENTLKKHSKNIYQKLAVKNKYELKLLFKEALADKSGNAL